MKVILTERIKNYGAIGDIVEVKPGYARNYLIPKNKAILATEDVVRKISDQKEQLRTRAEHLAIVAKDNYNLLNNKTLELKVRAHPKGHLYGSVTAKDILNLLTSQFALNLHKQQIKLGSPIRSVGQFEVSIVFSEELRAKIHLIIDKQDSNQ